MEPCLFRHGKPEMGLGSDLMQKWLQWSHVFSDMVRLIRDMCAKDCTELQWSHVFSDMVSTTNTSEEFYEQMLQWSHVFSDMVRKVVDKLMDDLLQLQWSHVFSDMVSVSDLQKEYNELKGFNGAMSFQTW